LSRNLRKFARQTNLRLILGGLVLVFIVGDGLIYLLYGPTSALTGLLCLLAGMIPVGLIALILLIMDWVGKRANRE
jgi:hypothetical protein